MPSAPSPERTPPGGLDIARLARFGVVGIGATLLYAVLAAILASDAAGLDALPASVTAYAVATLFSYAGHKFFTYGSDGAHRQEAPRFLVVTVCGFAIASLLPWLLTNRLGFPPLVPILATCIVVPLFNLVVLERWVFTKRHP